MVTRRPAHYRLLAAALLLLIAPSARACLNDRDTLAVEARQSPDVLRVITGRFERNPPLYYTMRIDREKGEVAKNPTLLDDYDDIAVTYDRIGDDDDAIAPYYSPMQKLMLLTMAAIGVVCLIAVVDRYRQSRRLRNG